jgi:hypothetical protein
VGKTFSTRNEEGVKRTSRPQRREERLPMNSTARHQHRRRKVEAEIRDLEEIATQLAALKSEAEAWLTDPSYEMVQFRLEETCSAVEAAATEARHSMRREHEGEPSTEKARELVGASR